MKKLIYSKEDLDLILTLELEEKDKKIERLHSIIKEVRKYLKLREDDNSMCSVCGVMSEHILEILDKAGKE